MNEVYASVITAGTHLASTIKVAEAAKVIENSQRDINMLLLMSCLRFFLLWELIQPMYWKLLQLNGTFYRLTGIVGDIA